MIRAPGHKAHQLGTMVPEYTISNLADGTTATPTACAGTDQIAGLIT